MGADNSVLQGCQWGQEVTFAPLDWDLQHAELKDGRPITVFHPRKNERKHNDMLQRLAKSLKLLRHPSILRYVGSGRSSSSGCHLVTEQATPLGLILEHLSPAELCSGLCDLLEALTFLHDKAGVAHNNVCVSAIFVSKDGSWKLGELQHACPFNQATAEYLDACRAFRDQDALAPEEKQNGVSVEASQGHARDMYGVGVLCEQLMEQLSELGEFDKSFERKVVKCLSPDPSVRPRALEIKNNTLFQNDFIEILSFVRNVALKTAEEKAEFFRDLLGRLVALPEELVARRLAVPLLSRFILLDEAAVNHVVPHLLTPRTDSGDDGDEGVSPLLGAELFKIYVIPELQRIMLVHDVHIRLVLLQHFSEYAALFDAEVLQNEVFPQILLGLRDTDDRLVSSSLRALADLVPLLGGDTVIGGQRKTFFFQGMPKFLPMREKETSPRSVGEVLLPSNAAKLAPNGKPFLKDLVAGGVPEVSREAAQERGKVERERRREESRKKREERQRKQRLMQAEKEANSQKTTLLEMTQRSAAENDDDNDDDDNLDNDDGGDQRIISPSHDSVERTDEALLRAEEEKFASEESPEEWEDWDTPDKNDNSAVLTRSQDDVISDEIEAELSHMTGKNRCPRDAGKKVPTSPDPYVPSSLSNTEADWSDSRFVPSSVSDSKRSSRREDGKGEKGHDSPNKKDDDIISTEKSSSESKVGKGLKLVGRNKTASAAVVAAAKTSAAKKKTAAGDDLGLGYDVKSIELSVVREEEDFFADMAPEIKPSAGKGSLLTAGETGESKGTSLEVKTGEPGLSLFAVADAAVEESGGWDDEGEWGGDF